MPYRPSTRRLPRAGRRRPQRRVLRVPREGVLPALADLVDGMLRADPAQRPTIGQVHATLMSIRPASDAAPAPAPTTLRRRIGAAPAAPTPAAPTARPTGRPSTPAAPPSGALRGKGLRISGSAASPPEPETADAKPVGGLVGKLVGRLTGRTRR